MYTELYLEELNNGAKSISDFLPILQNKCILITGASGVLGKQLTDVLLMFNKQYNANISICAVGRDENKLRKIFNYFDDKNLHLLNYKMMLDMSDNVDYIVHLASITSSKMFIETPVNVLNESYSLTKMMLDFAVSKKVKMFNYVSSVEVYGKPYSDQKIFYEDMNGELLTTQVRNSYPEAKRFCEVLTLSYMKQFGLNTVISRPAKVFSIVINKTDKRVFNDFAQKVVNKENIILKSDGKQVFTYCYGLDAVVGLLIVLLKGKIGEAYNIGNDNAVASISDVANEFAKQGNVEVEFHLEDSKKTGYVNVGHCIVDSTKLKTLGFEPQIDLKSGVRNIIKQYEII